MKNSIGSSVILTLFGESHGEAIGAVLDGMAPGLEVKLDIIEAALAKRRPQGPTDTARREPDNFKIVSGVWNGRTTGTPICIVIPNENTRSQDYEKSAGLARPGHADYTAHIKYAGFEDYRGGGHFSGRITAGIVAAGAIATEALKAKGIRIGTHILQCGPVTDKAFANFSEEMDILDRKNFPVIDNIEDAVSDYILKAKDSLDSVGGIIQTAITGLPAGVGEPWFDSLEGVISKAMFAIGGIKGIEFGAGFAIAEMKGSEANDPLCNIDGTIRTRSNNNGGINGGISNGMPVIFNCAVKPTPSIAREQDTIDLNSGKEGKLNLVGRHDPAIIRRICIVVSSLTAIVMCDELAKRYGTDWIRSKENAE